MDEYDLLDVFADASAMVEDIVDKGISSKGTFVEPFKRALQDQIDQIGAIYATTSNESPFKYDLGVLLDDLATHQWKLMNYELTRTRRSQSYKVKLDAYSDPDVAALAEYTVGGLKNKNKFYKK